MPTSLEGERKYLTLFFACAHAGWEPAIPTMREQCATLYNDSYSSTRVRAIPPDPCFDSLTQPALELVAEEARVARR